MELALIAEDIAEIEPGIEGAAHKTGQGPLVAIRDSKMPDGPRLYFTQSEWTAFRLGLIDGEFDHLG